MKFLLRLSIVVVFLFVFFAFKTTSQAQVCSGLFSVGTFQSVCINDFTGAPCTSGDPNCTCNTQCVDTGVLKACSNYNNNQVACLACKGGLGECCDSSFPDCSWPAPTPTPICGGGAVSYCSFGGGYYCCGSNMYCIGDASSFSCSSTPPATPTATPAPAGCTITSTYCGSACVSCGVTSDRYLDTCGNCVTTGTFTGAWCQQCADGCAPGTGACPVGATTAPTTAPGGGGGCASGISCGSGCCSTGQTCDPGPPASCTGGGGGVTIETCSEYCSVLNPANTGTCRSSCLTGEFYNSSAGAICTNTTSSATPDCCCGVAPTAVPTTPPSFCGNGACSGGETCSTCPSDCGACSYTISGNVYIDANSNGAKDTGEANYTTGATVTLSLGSQTRITNASGNYSYTSLSTGTYNIALTIPSGYTLTTTNPLTRSLGPSTTANFGIIANPPPDCPGGITADPTTVNPGSTSTLSVTGCTGIGTPTPTPLGNPTATPTPLGNPTPTPTPSTFDWDPPVGPNPQCSDGIDNDGDGVIDSLDPGCHTDNDPTNPGTYNPRDDSELNPSNTCSDAGTGNPNNAPTSSTVTWTAPSCPSVQLICQPSVVVSSTSGGGSTTYPTSLTVPATYSVTTHVRSVVDVSSCTPESGSGYSGARVNTTNNTTVNVTQTTNASGVSTFTCLPNGNYQVTVIPPSSYSVVGTNGGTSTSGNTINITPLSGNTTVTFCIAPTNPWFQTTIGDVRFVSLTNPIPEGKYGASDSSNPGIYYSSNSDNSLGNGTVSEKGWAVNNEYSYNANTENRNGTMGYGFIKSKARQDGVVITPITAGTLNQNEITGTGIYESAGDLTINSYSHTNLRRVVILVNGNVTINANAISVPVGEGLFILAAKGNITIAKTIGTATFNLTTTSIDGYYTAEKNIIVDGDGCADGTTPDLRLNVGGALIANSLKPFSITGLGTLKNNRSLCLNNLTYPSLYVASRPDFLTQLTDFYKVSYTKWQEEKP